MIDEAIIRGEDELIYEAEKEEVDFCWKSKIEEAGEWAKEK